MKCEVIGVYLVNLWCIGNDSIKVFGNYVKCIFFFYEILSLLDAAFLIFTIDYI